MRKQSIDREIRAVLAAILFLGLGFLAIWIGKYYIVLEGEGVFITLILIPVILYLILSGRLTEFRGPGGLEAKFVNVAGQTVESVAETVEPSIADMEIVAKAGMKELERQIRRLDESKPIVLTLTLGREGYYDRYVWIRYMEALSQYRTFKFVVILDTEGKFAAFVPSWAILHLLRMDELGNEFVQTINRGSAQELRRYPGVVTTTISTETSNVDALKEMTASNLEALVVIDKEHRLRGVVEREQLISKLLIGIAK